MMARMHSRQFSTCTCTSCRAAPLRGPPDKKTVGSSLGQHTRVPSHFPVPEFKANQTSHQSASQAACAAGSEPDREEHLHNAGGEIVQGLLAHRRAGDRQVPEVVGLWWVHALFLGAAGLLLSIQLGWWRPAGRPVVV